MGSPTGVPVPCASTMPTVSGVHARHSQCRPIGRDLRGLRRCGDVHRAAVLVGGRAAHHSQDPVTIAQRIRQPLEQHHDGSPRRPRTRRRRRRTHGSGRSRTACRWPNPRTDFRGSSNTEAPPARAMSLSPSCRLRQARCTATQAGRARGIHRHRRTVQAHGVGDPPGRHAEVVAQ